MATELLTDAQRAELLLLKRSLPFRLCFAAISPAGEVEYAAKHDRRWANAKLRKGWQVIEAVTS